MLLEHQWNQFKKPFNGILLAGGELFSNLAEWINRIFVVETNTPFLL